MTTVDLTCEYCLNTFQRSLQNLHSKSRVKCRNFCCPGHRTAFYLKHGPPRGNAKRTELTRFNRFMSNIRMRNKERGIVTEITAKDLLKIWQKQKGICPYTGWELELPPNAVGWKDAQKHIRRASVDRIDRKAGYTVDNIQFVSVMANFAKNEFSSEDLLNFCTAVVNKMVPTGRLALPRGTVFETAGSAIRA